MYRPSHLDSDCRSEMIQEVKLRTCRLRDRNVDADCDVFVSGDIREPTQLALSFVWRSRGQSPPAALLAW
jgi:hypothetical protein